MKLGLVIPAKDEAPTVGHVIRSFAGVAKTLGFQACPILIDDHSADGTSSIAARLGVPVLRPDQRGLASASRVGVQAALDRGCDLILHVDADNQYSAHDLITMIDAIGTSDLVIGNRLWTRQSMTRRRYEMNRLASKLVSRALKARIPDTQSGFRLFTREVAEVHVHLAGTFTYTQEQCIEVARRGGRIASVPVRFDPRVNGRSRLARFAAVYAVRVGWDLAHAQSGIRSAERPSDICCAGASPLAAFAGRAPART